jgi:hypothetical protein
LLSFNFRIIEFFLSKKKDQVAFIGRAKIEMSRLKQIAKIEENRKVALANLNIKYSLADKVKTSFGYIGITFLSVSWGLIILNDLAKLLKECYRETKDLLEERRGKMKDGRKENEIEQVKIELEQEEKYAQDLDEKLEKIHLQLIKAIAAKRANRK